MIISVASGKGGTGKTTVAVNLAMSLAGEGKVCLLDCDVEEPNAEIFLKPEIREEIDVEVPVPEIDDSECTYCGECARICRYNALIVLKDSVMVFPELCHGCGGCTLLCPTGAVSEKGRKIGVVRKGSAGGVDFASGVLSIGEALSPPVIKEVKKFAGKDAVNIIDAPPGTSCPVVESVRGSDFCLLVTEPTPFGLNDLKLAMEVLGDLKIPIGVVINKSSEEDDADTDAFCREVGAEVVLKIPWDPEIARKYSTGTAICVESDEWREKFRGLYRRIEKAISAGEGASR